MSRPENELYAERVANLVKGTPSRGKRNKPSHITCRRCGHRSFSIPGRRCAHCGFGETTQWRKYSWIKPLKAKM